MHTFVFPIVAYGSTSNLCYLCLVSTKQGHYHDFLVWYDIQGHVFSMGTGRLQYDLDGRVSHALLMNVEISLDWILR